MGREANPHRFHSPFFFRASPEFRPVMILPAP
jgi:hypothetical protein